MTKFEIKAIRYIAGFSPDLRKQIPFLGDGRRHLYSRQCYTIADIIEARNLAGIEAPYDDCLKMAIDVCRGMFE